MDDQDKFLYCRHCGFRFHSDLLQKHEDKCSRRKEKEAESEEPVVSKKESEEPVVVSKKVLRNGEDSGPEETHVVIEYPEDGTKEIVTKCEEDEDDGTKHVVTKEKKLVDEDGAVEKVVKTTTKEIDDGKTQKVVKETVTTKNDGTEEVRKTTEHHEKAPGVSTRKVFSRDVQKSGDMSPENEEALQQLKDLAPVLNPSHVLCIHCHQDIPREEYRQHAKDCRRERSEKIE